jgi:hypothetical protein
VAAAALETVPEVGDGDGDGGGDCFGQISYVGGQAIGVGGGGGGRRAAAAGEAAPLAAGLAVAHH